MRKNIHNLILCSVFISVGFLISCGNIIVESPPDGFDQGCGCGNLNIRTAMLSEFGLEIDSLLDVDYDCLNDRAELFEENQLLYFYSIDSAVCRDRDLSVADGPPSGCGTGARDSTGAGRLHNGLMLPTGFNPIPGNMFDGGDGYITYHGSDGRLRDHWGTHELVDCLISAASNWSNIELFGQPHHGVEMNIGDMSLEFGGAFTNVNYPNSRRCSTNRRLYDDAWDHGSHQNGLDVDIRYARNDDQNAPLNISESPANLAYDSEATLDMMASLVEICNVEVIFVDLDNLGFDANDINFRVLSKNVPETILNDEPGHSDHFHLRLRQ